MIIFAAGALGTRYTPDLKLNILESYFIWKNRELKIDREYVKRFFLDSGAYSAWSKRVPIRIEYYIDYIKRNIDKIDYYACLDVIGNAEDTFKNQEIMEAVGLNPIPVYHYGEKFDIFKKLCEKYKYIAIGGMVPISTKQLESFLDHIFEYICEKDGSTKIKLHGFGMTTLSLMEKYPWYSVDSISPIMTGAMGGIYDIDGKVISLARKEIIPHAVKIYLEREKYEDKTGFILPATAFKENLLTKGFTYDDLRYKYRARIVVNLRYIMLLEQRLTENPPRFIQHQKKLFN